MAQTDKQNDEELLILSDDNDSSDTNFVLNSDEDRNDAISNDWNNEALLFDTTIEDAPKTEVHDDFTLSFDSDDKEAAAEQESLLEENNTWVNDNGFSFDLAWTSSSSNLSQSETMFDIIDETISKLQSRSDKIEWDISLVDSEAKDLASRISELEKQVKDKEAEKEKLSSEKTAIAKNIKSLEKMKTDSSKIEEVA